MTALPGDHETHTVPNQPGWAAAPTAHLAIPRALEATNARGSLL